MHDLQNSVKNTLVLRESNETPSNGSSYQGKITSAGGNFGANLSILRVSSNLGKDKPRASSFQAASINANQNQEKRKKLNVSKKAIFRRNRLQSQIVSSNRMGLMVPRAEQKDSNSLSNQSSGPNYPTTNRNTLSKPLNFDRS